MNISDLKFLIILFLNFLLLSLAQGDKKVIHKDYLLFNGDGDGQRLSFIQKINWIINDAHE